MNALTRAGLALVLAIFVGLPAAARDDADVNVAPYLITTGDPSDPTYANAGANLRNGVGSIFIGFNGIPDGGFLCTATAISPTHILTAAHCVTQAGDSVSEIIFVLNADLAAPEFRSGIAFQVHPYWDAFSSLGAFAPGDVAVIELSEAIPSWVETYELYRAPDEFGKPTRHYGHGRSGKGNKGATGDADFFSARTGLNRYEQVFAPLLGPLPPSLAMLFDQLVHDFDSGGRKHNAMEWWYTGAWACHPDNPNNPPQAQDGQCTTFKDGSYPDFKGFGTLEVGIAPGDSGGPGFVDGKIAGIHSFGFTSGCGGVTNIADFNCELDSSYGEMAGDTRVSTYAGWIDDVVAGGIPMRAVPEDPVQEPAATGDAGIAGQVRFGLGNVRVRNLRQAAPAPIARQP